ncbi:MAG: tetratricopeptide (TPR) repeat protein [Kiritimatiellia bacterium]|jgi:tetratricopeptide (TPR) repeat protein
MLIYILLALTAMGGVSREQADTAWENSDWPEAIKGYKAVTKATPEDAGAWNRLAHSQLRDKKYAKAAAAFEQAIKRGHYATSRVYYNLACAHALSNNTDGALDALTNSIDRGFNDPQWMGLDPDLQSLHTSKRFQELTVKAEINAHPCDHDERYQDLEFWTGTWEVRDAKGELAGTDTITRSQHGCALIETWQDARGWSGMSLNTFDPNTDVWRQHWVAETGTVANYTGKITQKSRFVLTGTESLANGEVRLVMSEWMRLDNGDLDFRIHRRGSETDEWEQTWHGRYVRVLKAAAR